MGWTNETAPSGVPATRAVGSYDRSKIFNMDRRKFARSSEHNT